MTITLKKAILSQRTNSYYPANQPLKAEYDGAHHWVYLPDQDKIKTRIANDNIKEISGELQEA